MRKILHFILAIVVLISGMASYSQNEGQTISGSTADWVNLRTGPGTGFAVISVLPYRTPVTFIGRNASGTWLLATMEAGRGWLSYTFSVVNGHVNSLPVVDGEISNSSSTNVTSNTTSTTQTTSSFGVASGASSDLTPRIDGTTRQIYLRGQEMGNHSDVFSKVGDSITASDLFLDPIGHGSFYLGDYEHLGSVIRYFSQTPARDHYSFANTSLAARGGWRAADVLNPARSTPGICLQNESPLVCEYRVNKPAIALIMLGTNDVAATDTASYSASMNRIVLISIDMGVIPVLSTIPDQPGTPNANRIREFNLVIARIASSQGIPLWDYWRAMQRLPNSGMSSDNIHPSYNYISPRTAHFTEEDLRYGYNMRNLTALIILDAVWRQAMQ